MGGVQGPLGDLVEAVGGGGHVFVHAVQEGVSAGGLVALPQLEAAARAVAVLPAALGVLRVAGQRGWRVDGRQGRG